MSTQNRAKAGGETGINGEFYEGGKFLPSREDRSKQAPPERHELTEEEKAKWAKVAERADQIAAWLTARRTEFGGIIAKLTQNPGMVDDATWAARVANHAAGFHPSLGRTLWVQGSVSESQAIHIAKFVHGRRTKANEAGFEGLVENLTTDLN